MRLRDQLRLLSPINRGEPVCYIKQVQHIRFTKHTRLFVYSAVYYVDDQADSPGICLCVFRYILIDQSMRDRGTYI